MHVLLWHLIIKKRSIKIILRNTCTSKSRAIQCISLLYFFSFLRNEMSHLWLEILTNSINVKLITCSLSHSRHWYGMRNSEVISTPRQRLENISPTLHGGGNLIVNYHGLEKLLLKFYWYLNINISLFSYQRNPSTIS